MRIFSKVVFICNCCFILSALLRILELGYKKGETVMPLPALEGSIVILGFFVAIIVNAIFFATIILKKVSKKAINISAFYIWFNLILLPIQCWYFFVKSK
ncbi:MAG: hypothetical protein HOO89_00730 [Ferruginibacter sp.]|nr:hypothetical protein [Ferruginibacter sp.]